MGFIGILKLSSSKDFGGKSHSARPNRLLAEHEPDSFLYNLILA
jgi:hypothetical protein